MPKRKSMAQIEREMAEIRGQEIREKLKGGKIYSQRIQTENQMIFGAYLMGKDDQFKMDLQIHDRDEHHA